jgi:hypothetical protein
MLRTSLMLTAVLPALSAHAQSVDTKDFVGDMLAVVAFCGLSPTAPRVLSSRRLSLSQIPSAWREDPNRVMNARCGTCST